MKKLLRCGVFSLLIILASTSGHSLKCYSCSSKLNEHCLNPIKYNLKPRLCDSMAFNHTKYYASNLDRDFKDYFEIYINSQDPQIPANCLKQVTKVGSKEVIIRGCQLAATEQLDVCKKVLTHEKDNMHITHCTLCNSDACNSSPVKFTFLFVFAALADITYLALI